MHTKQSPAKRWLKGGVFAAVATVGLMVGGAAPAFADPATSYVAVGSDTIQDIMNQFATNVGGGTVGSWNAVNPGNPTVAHDIINPKANCSFTRPNGSGEGLNALRKSINPSTTATQLAVPPGPGCVDMARSSSGPGANQDNNGALVYIPFALDAVTSATGPATAVTGSNPAVATAITHANDFTVANLTSLYGCNAVAVDGVTYTPDGTTTNSTNQPIHLYVPQAGSGTRNFWASTLGFNSTTLPTCVHDTSEINGAPVEEHDGTVYASDADGLGPFSIAQFIAQSNGHNDRRHNVAIHNLNGVSPTTSGALNTSFPITREVYNIVQLSRVTAGASFDPTLAGMLVGATSTLCSQSIAIKQFGFATLATSPLGHTCGQIATNLRAFNPSTNPV
ncbi:MAG TPA: substrate-binding domain-containing protein [Micromonosporaceae bacterium]|jgi:phosphate transport system substrate-binding protein